MSTPLSKAALDRLLAAAEPLLEGDSDLFLGRYRKIREIGRGGMGVVYEAFDTELSRRVALKVPTAYGLQAAEARERLVREAKAVASLDHPNIATIYDATPECLVMRYVDGVPLSKLPRGDTSLSARFIRDAARAVHDAHLKGFLHRDLKPQNLMSENGRIFVLDFGLAREIDAAASFTGEAALLGTPAYMAPEQASGHAREVDPRTDVYGLGATLFDLIAGRPPFEEKELPRLLRRIAEDDPPSFRSLGADVPADLENIVRRCLEKDRARRYQNALALADDLDRWLENRPVLARRPSLRYRLGKFLKRRRAAVLAFWIGGSLAMISALVALEQRAQRKTAQEALALSELVAIVEEDVGAHRRRGDMASARERLLDGRRACEAFQKLHDVAEAERLLGRLLRVAGEAAPAERALNSALAKDPALSSALVERGLLFAGEVARIESLRNAGCAEGPDATCDLPALRDRAKRDLLAAAASKSPLRAIDVAQVKAELHRLSGRYAEAKKAFAEMLTFDPANLDARLALTQLEVLLDRGDSAFRFAMSAMDVHRGFGPAYWARSMGSETKESLPDDIAQVVRQHELSAAESRVQSGDRSREAMEFLVDARISIRDLDGAMTDFATALANDPTDAMAYGSRALIRARQAGMAFAKGDVGRTLDEYRCAIRDCEAALALAPHLVGAWNNLGILELACEPLLRARSDHGEAQKAIARARAAFDEALKRNPRFLIALRNRAALLRRESDRILITLDPKKAMAEAELAIRDIEAALSIRTDDADSQLELASILRTMARIAEISADDAARTQRLREALAALDRALAIEPDSGKARGLRGLLRELLGDREGALADVDAALRLTTEGEFLTALEAARSRLR